jgi:hypothetical protein
MADDKSKAITSPRIALRGRLSFPKLDKAKPFEEGQEPRYEATTLLDPSDPKGLESIKLLLKSAADLGKEKWGIIPLAVQKLAAEFVPGTKPVDLNKVKDDGIFLAFYSGTEKADSSETETYESYRGMLVVPSHQYVSKPKPAIVNRKGETVVPGDEQWPYGGCYVVHYITLWTQTNLKKRIGINLKGIQFNKDGEAFGAGAEMTEQDFEALEDEAAAGDAGGMDWDT